LVADRCDGLMQSLSFSELSKQLSYLPKFSFETALKVYAHLATTANLVVVR
jgi:hypothetical protein